MNPYSVITISTLTSIGLGTVECSQADVFEIRQGELYLSTALDYERQAKLELDIIASDNKHDSLNSLHLIVMVGNMDDNLLEFDSYNYIQK